MVSLKSTTICALLTFSSTTLAVYIPLQMQRYTGTGGCQDKVGETTYLKKGHCKSWKDGIPFNTFRYSTIASGYQIDWHASCFITAYEDEHCRGERYESAFNEGALEWECMLNLARPPLTLRSVKVHCGESWGGGVA